MTAPNTATNSGIFNDNRSELSHVHYHAHSTNDSTQTGVVNSHLLDEVMWETLVRYEAIQAFGKRYVS
ncbi:hypothetical protein ACFL1P_00625 [Patescibacteria group bacterium]